MTDKSLQINLNSLDDAKALIQNLGYVKKAYDAHKCTSIMLVVNEASVVEIETQIKGLINWTRAFIKIIRPAGEGTNVLIHLPHYVPPAAMSTAPKTSEPIKEPKRRMGRIAGWQPPGKSQPPVQAELTGP